MRYPLQNMLNVRRIREDRAEVALAVALGERREAERVKREKTRRREKYDETKESRRDKVFDTVIGHVVRCEDIDLVREALHDIDEEGVLLRKDEDRAKETLQVKIKAEDGARTVYVVANRNHLKTKEHRSIWVKEEDARLEHIEDLELEEFKGREVELDDGNADS